MAAIFVPPSPQTSFAMSSRRPPLANVPNAANSPHRSSNSAAMKRARTGSQMDLVFGQPPPKKQVVDREDVGSPSKITRPTTTMGPQVGAESRMFSRRSHNAQVTPFEKRLMAVREQKERGTAQARNSKYEKASAEKLDNIRQWQRHYRKAFPSFVFYFDSIPTDVRNRSLREVLALGASEERFFSRTVTHVVTSRPIPEIDVPSPIEITDNEQTPLEGPIQTVNPVLLERNDSRRDHGNNTDVLYRARQMGMKIWAIEKLQRMLAAIHEPDTPAAFNNGSRISVLATKGRGESELSQVLRNERLHGPSDRDPSQLMKDLVFFRGPYIYVHDMDEKTRPVMVREYQKVAKRQDGVWPQFRSAPLGKCPFIEEAPSKKEIARMKEEEERKKVAANQEKIPKVENVQQQTQNQIQLEKQAKADVAAQLEGEDDTASVGTADMVKPFSVRPAPPRVKPESHSIKPPMAKLGAWPMIREPAASGVQPSNITSAIRSQMVSSTAAAPGAKAGLSKEVHELKRKVLEKSNGSMITSANPSSHRNMDAFMNVKITSGASAGSKRPREKLGHIYEEDTTQSEDNGSNNISQNADRKGGSQKKATKEKQRDPKPGYCENCRDKFDDFDEHTMTRKHRKFALTLSNWVELDNLLSKLERPVKELY